MTDPDVVAGETEAAWLEEELRVRFLTRGEVERGFQLLGARVIGRETLRRLEHVVVAVGVRLPNGHELVRVVIVQRYPGGGRTFFLAMNADALRGLLPFLGEALDG